MVSIPWKNVSPPPGVDALPIAPSPRSPAGQSDDSFGEHLRQVDEEGPGAAPPAQNNAPPPQEPVSSDEEGAPASAPSAPDAQPSPAEPQDASSEEEVDGEDGEPKAHEEDASSAASEMAAAAAKSGEAALIPDGETAQGETAGETDDAQASARADAKPDSGGASLNAPDAVEAPAGRDASGEDETRPKGLAPSDAQPVTEQVAKAGGPTRDAAKEATGAMGDEPTPTDPTPDTAPSRDASAKDRGGEGEAGSADMAALAAASRAAEETLATGEGEGARSPADQAAPLKDSDRAPTAPRAELRGAAATPPDSNGPRPPQQAIASPVEGGAESRTMNRAQQARFVQRVARAFSAARDRGGELRLRLSPPELGSLHLQIKVQHGVLAARLETETSLARTVLLDNLPVLRERLAEQGVRIEQFDVNFAGRQFGGPPQDGMRNPDQGLFPPAPAGDRNAAGDGAGPADDQAAPRRLVDQGRLNVIV